VLVSVPMLRDVSVLVRLKSYNDVDFIILSESECGVKPDIAMYYFIGADVLVSYTCHR
jgi:hypothetical protein